MRVTFFRDMRDTKDRRDIKDKRDKCVSRKCSLSVIFSMSLLSFVSLLSLMSLKKSPRSITILQKSTKTNFPHVSRSPHLYFKIQKGAKSDFRALLRSLPYFIVYSFTTGFRATPNLYVLDARAFRFLYRCR
jgi:ABC-type anion transport system duplicated permease subunit